MEEAKLHKVLQEAAKQKDCIIVNVDFDDDDNIIEVTIDKENADVTLGDCEFIHRAVLAEFDRNIEDYSLTVTSLGIDAAEADELLRNMDDNQ